MTPQEEAENSDGEWLIKGGCSCFGVIGCLILAILLVASLLAGGTLLLVTGPPLEYISQATSFLENYSILVVILLLLLAVLVGGGGGFFIGSLIANQRRRAANSM